MSERGVFGVDRGIFDHHLFDGHEFSRREAWLWLVSEAAWKGKSVRVAGKTVELQRGQLCHSVRFIADKWGWSKSTVQRFLDTLKNEAMIEAENGTDFRIISICKYEEYQKVSLPRGTVNGTHTGTLPGQQRDKEEGRKRKKEESSPSQIELIPAPTNPDAWPKDYREQFWSAYPRKVEKKAALDALDRVHRAATIPWKKFIAAVRSYAARSTDPKYTKHPTTWLNRGCWDDEPGLKTNGNGAGKPVEETREIWESRARLYRQTGNWKYEWGPDPAYPECRMPEDLIKSISH